MVRHDARDAARKVKGQDDGKGGGEAEEHHRLGGDLVREQRVAILQLI